MNISKRELKEASKGARSYSEFRENLKGLGCKVPFAVSKFPTYMKGWVRKLRYEFSQDIGFGEHPTTHDLRQKEYYLRLERIGCKDPVMVM